MKIDRSITLFLNYCRSKQLRPKMLQSYEQTLALFAKWLRESEKIEEVDQIREITIREYMSVLPTDTKSTPLAMRGADFICRIP